MISEFTLKAIGPIALSLKAANKRIDVEKNSPVEILNRASATPLFNDRGITDTEFFERFPLSLKRDVVTGDTEVVEYSIDGKPFKDIPVAQHETTLAEVKRELADCLLDLESFCRGVVHPAIQAIFERFEDPQYAQSKELWSLVPIPEPTYLDSAVFETIISRIPSGELDKSVRSVMPKHFPENLEIAKTGHSVFDKTINELMTTLNVTPYEIMRGAWTMDFGHPSNPQAWEKLPRVALTLLMLIYFKDNPWEESGLALSSWNDTFETQVIMKGQWIRGYLEATKWRVDNGLLIAGYDMSKRLVFLHSNVWDEYIKQGGVVESLHGALCRCEEVQEYEITSQSLIDDEHVNIRTWESFHAVKEASNTVEWLNETRQRLLDAVCEWIDSVDDDSIFPTDTWRKNARANVRDYIQATLQVADLKDATSYLIDLLFHTVFTHVDGRQYMQDIHSLVKEGTPIKNASYFAMRKYLENYVFSGLLIE